MKFVKKLISTVLSLTISGLIIAWSSVSILSSATAVNSLVASAGLYEQAASMTSTQMSSMLVNADVPEEYRTTISQVFERTITPAQVEVVFQPLLVDIISWLDQPKGTPQPQLVLNLAPVKARLEEEFKKTTLSEIEQAAIISQVAKQIPDQLDLGKINKEPGDSGSKDSNQVPLTGIESFDTMLEPSNGEGQAAPSTEMTLDNIKGAYTWLRTIANVGVVVMVLLFGLLIWLGRKDGRQMFTRPAWIFFSAGLITALFWLFAQFYRPDDSQVALSAIMDISREIVAVSIWYGAVALAVGTTLYGLSFIIKKQPNISSDKLVDAVKSGNILPKSSDEQKLKSSNITANPEDEAKPTSPSA